jgi:hypothetical protein
VVSSKSGQAELGRQIRDQALIVQEIREPACRHVGSIAQHHDALEGAQLRRQPLEQRQEHGIGENVAILGVVHDVGDLFGEQARVDGMADRADAGDAVVQLEVAVVVPGERGDPLAWPDAEPVPECLRQLLRAPAQVGVGGAVRGRIRRARHHLDRAIALGRVIEDRRYQKRPVHHQAAHHRLRTRKPLLSARLCALGGAHELSWPDRPRMLGGSEPHVTRRGAIDVGRAAVQPVKSQRRADRDQDRRHHRRQKRLHATGPLRRSIITLIAGRAAR